MKLIYAGKYSGDPETLPGREHEPGAVKFREFDDAKKLSRFANIAAIFLLAALAVVYGLRSSFLSFNFWGAVASLVAAFPHELLHALCFRREVYLYTNLKQGMLFVVGPEDMSRGRFVFMSLLPNIIFGFLPFAIFLIWPQNSFLGTMGMLSVTMGVGDYYNVYNALTQMPRQARTYLHRFNSYWYMPEGPQEQSIA